MKKYLYCSVFLFSMFSHAQNSEFKVYNNGLIYSENAVGKLKHIVDSLNLKFKVCEIDKKFHSRLQAKAHYVALDKGKMSAAKNDIGANISFEDFRKKYPKAVCDENLLLTRAVYTDYDGKEITEFNDLEIGKNSGHSIAFRDAKIQQSGNWIYAYQTKSEDASESLEAFYLTEKLQSKPLPLKYSRMIQYADCLVDTTAQVFMDNVKQTGRRFYDTIPNKADAFNAYVENVLKRPVFDFAKFDILLGMDTINFEDPAKKVKLTKKQRAARETKEKKVAEEFSAFEETSKRWESTRLFRIDSLKQANADFMPMLKEAYDEIYVSHASNDNFEELVGIYISAESALELKRNRRVIGGCSMDNSPRLHAFKIALLSAETTKWEIFLRAHLDIMNDRFDRVSDGSWAVGARETYIKELEVLDINVADLILGISLRIENPSQNHYFGSINRIGRALAESHNNIQIETSILDMIADDELDDLNRVMMYFLFDNYNYHLKDRNRKEQNFEKIKIAVSKMPAYVYSKIDLSKN